MPEPDPMPEHLVQRINASLAAEQAQRAARTSSALVIPLRPTARRRAGRILFAVAGAAAAVALVAVVGSNMLAMNEQAATSGSAAIATSSDTTPSDTTSSGTTPSDPTTLYAQEDSRGGLPSADKAAAGAIPTPALVQIRVSGTRYTQADFVTQAGVLRDATLDPRQRMKAEASGLGPASTTVGLTECLKAIGAGGAQAVRADIALYEGRPAVIIVATTGGIPVAFAVGRQCSPADAAVLHAATELP
jgi:hypothetical protein